MRFHLYKFAATITVLLACGLTALADIKYEVEYRAGGQTSRSTMYIKGQRQRFEQGGAGRMYFIMQCDQKRNIMVDEQNRTYMVMPLDSKGGFPGMAPGQPSSPPQRSTSTTPRRGGVVTITTEIVDTGERKQMFGHTARHIITTVTHEASHDSCSPGKSTVKTDAWVIDYRIEFDCKFDSPVGPPAQRPATRTVPDCEDQIKTINKGNPALMGFPILSIITTTDENGRTHTTEMEVKQLSVATLDQSLFEPPAGFTEMKLPTGLAEGINIGAAGRDSRTGTPTAPTAIGEKAAGGIRIGVIAVKDSSGRSLDVATMRLQLISKLDAGNVDAVPIEATTPEEIKKEAVEKKCDYTLDTSVLEAKASTPGGRIGGVFGRATGGLIKEKVNMKLEYQLTKVANWTPLPKKQLTETGEGTGPVGPESATGQAIDRATSKEAEMVLSDIRQNR